MENEIKAAAESLYQALEALKVVAMWVADASGKLGEAAEAQKQLKEAWADTKMIACHYCKLNGKHDCSKCQLNT